MPENKIRLLIVDDHKVVRNGLKIFISLYDDIEIVGEAKNGRLALAQCAETHPDVILMDLMMPVMDGPAAIRLIREQYPQIQIVALTSFEEEELVQQAMAAGAIGFLYKDVEEEELVGAIRAARAGKSVLALEAVQALVKQATKPLAPFTIDPLTEREREILTLMAQGLTNPQIAQELVISDSTVRFHTHNIFNKLQVQRRTEAVVVAMQNNLIDT
ncbi:MAG: response regulator transcription factor [Chloroflexi bacterium]|nr:response regulator transcription factor [Chloroflexota bacterium]